jgi:OmcA/MtrC family decaheme c-type cytochrome
MKRSVMSWGSALAVVLALAGCGGGSSKSDPVVVPPPPTATLAEKIAAAAANAANDAATSTTAPFMVLQDAGVPAVTVQSPPVVNFAVFSDGKVVQGLTTSNARLIIAKLVPPADGNPHRWESYITRVETATAGVGPGGTPVLASAVQATTDSGGTLEYKADGYYSYTFKTDIKDVAATRGVVFEPSMTHRVAIQLSYDNAAGERVLVNPYLDFTIDASGNSVPVTDPAQTFKMTDVASCNSCHEKLALHGGGRIDTQYCVTCHNPGTIDANSGNVLTMSTMTHKIHAGRLLHEAGKAGKGGEDYVIWGFRDSKHDYTEVGFPQDLRNCTKCHTASNPDTPQGDNWKTVATTETCMSCHASKEGSDWYASHTTYAGTLVGAGSKATDLTNQQCSDCHKAGTNIGPDRVHFNQVEVNAAKYKMNIVSATLAVAPTDTTDGEVQVSYYLSDPTNGDAKYKLEDDPGRFGSLSLYLTWPSLAGQVGSAVTEYTSYNNGGGGARVTAISGSNDGSNVYTNTIKIPKNTATSIASGTALVASIGQIKEPRLEAKWATDPRPPVVPAETVNTLAQNTSIELAITGALNPRRTIVSNEKCNACHGALGATSGSNTLANAFHSGARNTVEACVICHDENRMSSTVMTNGLALNENYGFKRMIHGIHGNSKRTYPFTHGNPVQGPFDQHGVLVADGMFLANYRIRGFSPLLFTAGTPVAAGNSFETIGDLITSVARDAGYTGSPVEIENYAAEVAWPGVGVNCNACHVDNSYKVDRGQIGSVVAKPADAGSDPMLWSVISPQAATCTSCHDSSASIGHVTSFGNSSFSDRTQAQSMQTQETCSDCHASGGFKGVDIVHGLK